MAEAERLQVTSETNNHTHYEISVDFFVDLFKGLYKPSKDALKECAVLRLLVSNLTNLVLTPFGKLMQILDRAYKMLHKEFTKFVELHMCGDTVTLCWTSYKFKPLVGDPLDVTLSFTITVTPTPTPTTTSSTHTIEGSINVVTIQQDKNKACIAMKAMINGEAFTFDIALQKQDGQPTVLMYYESFAYWLVAQLKKIMNDNNSSQPLKKTRSIIVPYCVIYDLLHRVSVSPPKKGIINDVLQALVTSSNDTKIPDMYHAFYILRFETIVTIASLLPGYKVILTWTSYEYKDDLLVANPKDVNIYFSISVTQKTTSSTHIVNGVISVITIEQNGVNFTNMKLQSTLMGKNPFAFDLTLKKTKGLSVDQTFIKTFANLLVTELEEFLPRA